MAKFLHPCLFLFLLAAAVLTVPDSLAAYAPLDNHLLDCGAASATTTDDRRVFLPDDSPRFALRSSRSAEALADSSPSSTLPVLYRTARVFTAPASYRFPVADRGAPHFLRLHFRPFRSPGRDLTSARFHVGAFIGDAPVLLIRDFTSDGFVVKEFVLRVDSDWLEITFAPAEASSAAFVNAIEVFSAPLNIFSDLARSELGDGYRNWNITRKVMETVHRINVGGAKITPFNDSLWRTWVTDNASFLDLSVTSASRTIAFSGRLNRRTEGPSSEVAPDNVYRTCRVADSSSNLRWAFHLNPGSRYLVRMHFCDIVSWALNQLYFDIIINGNLVYEGFDLSEATEQFLASPYYIDFIVSPDGKGLLSLGSNASSQSAPSKVAGLLNGLEIFKLHSSMGCLDGEFPLDGILQSPSWGGFAVFLRSLLCGLVFVGLVGLLFMLVQRWRIETRNSVAWSPLPLDATEGKLPH